MRDAMNAVSPDRNRGGRRPAWPVLLIHNLDAAWTEAEIAVALDEVRTLETALKAQGHPVANLAVRDGDLKRLLEPFDPGAWVVFNNCEGLPGIPGSEARVIGLLDEMGFAYTGASAAAMDLAWDKPRVKRLLDEHGLPTPRWRLCDTPDPAGWRIFPAIVKPAREHCSLGVTTDAVATEPGELAARIAFILDSYRQPALVEDFIDGREFHVSVWGDGEMLPAAEMDFAAFAEVKDRLCTYESKFQPGSRHYDGIGLKLPADLSSAEYGALRRTVVEGYRVVGCRDYARLDLRLRDGVFYILDINPNPDISSETSMACAAEVAGFSYGAMLSRIVNFAARRHPVFGA